MKYNDDNYCKWIIKIWAENNDTKWNKAKVCRRKHVGRIQNGREKMLCIKTGLSWLQMCSQIMSLMNSTIFSADEKIIGDKLPGCKENMCMHVP